MAEYLKYDYRSMMSGAVGRRGISPSEMRSMAPRMTRARKRLEGMRTSGILGFYDLPWDAAGVRECERTARVLRREGCTDLVVIGIGGSDLGTRTLIRALDVSRGMCVSFLGNPDPEELAHTLRGLDPKKTAVNVVSKSGETLEITAVFLAVRDWLVRGVGAARAARRIVATTGDRGGALRDGRA